MSLRNLEQENILTNNSGGWSFGKKVSLAIGAFVLSANLALAEPNKTIGVVNFMEGGTAELYKDKNGAYGIRNGNSKNGSDLIYGTTIIDGKKYIVYSSGYDHEIEVFLEAYKNLYREYASKYGEKRAYKLIKAREQYLENFFKDNPISNFSSEFESEKKALESWELILNKINNK